MAKNNRFKHPNELFVEQVGGTFRQTPLYFESDYIPHELKEILKHLYRYTLMNTKQPKDWDENIEFEPNFDCFASQKRLARDTGKSQRQAERDFAKLRDLKLIEVMTPQKKKQKGNSNYYKLIFHPILLNIIELKQELMKKERELENERNEENAKKLENIDKLIDGLIQATKNAPKGDFEALEKIFAIYSNHNDQFELTKEMESMTNKEKRRKAFEKGLEKQTLKELTEMEEAEGKQEIDWLFETAEDDDPFGLWEKEKQTAGNSLNNEPKQEEFENDLNQSVFDYEPIY